MYDGIYLFELKRQISQLHMYLHNVRKTLAFAAKFLCALLLYCVVNFVVSGMFKTTRLVPLEFFQMLMSAFREIVCQNFVLATSLYFQYKYIVVSLMAFVFVVSLIIKISVNNFHVNVQCFDLSNSEDFAQYTVRRANVFSYRQHVAFLA